MESLQIKVPRRNRDHLPKNKNNKKHSKNYYGAKKQQLYLDIPKDSGTSLGQA